MNRNYNKKSKNFIFFYIFFAIDYSLCDMQYVCVVKSCDLKLREQIQLATNSTRLSLYARLVHILISK